MKSPNQNNKLKEKTLTAEDAAAEIYRIGFKNGSITMKNKILKKINRDWTLLREKNNTALVIKILKVINKIK